MNAKAPLPILLLALLVAALPPRRPVVYLVGDSTVADRPNLASPERGWGQLLPRFLDSGVVVSNHAVNGRSTKSFIDEGRWDSVRAALRPGDFVLVEFGHNDEKREDSTRFTNPYTGYRRNLARFVAEARAAGATPVLLTPIVRRHFNEHGVLEDTHGAYTEVVRDVARDEHAPLVDLQQLTEDLVLAAGPEGSKALYAWVAPGTNAVFPEGRQDDTHLSVDGATAVARLAAIELARLVPGLRAHVVAH